MWTIVVLTPHFEALCYRQIPICLYTTLLEKAWLTRDEIRFCQIYFSWLLLLTSIQVFLNSKESIKCNIIKEKLNIWVQKQTLHATCTCMAKTRLKTLLSLTTNPPKENFSSSSVSEPWALGQICVYAKTKSWTLKSIGTYI